MYVVLNVPNVAVLPIGNPEIFGDIAWAVEHYLGAWARYHRLDGKPVILYMHRLIAT